MGCLSVGWFGCLLVYCATFVALRILFAVFCLFGVICWLRCRLSWCVGLVDWFWAGVVRVLLICWGLVCWVVCCVWYCGFAVFADCAADGGVLVGMLRFVIV